MKVLSAALAAALILSSVSFSQGRPEGIRISVNSVDASTGEVDFDVTLNTAYVYGTPTVTSPTGLLGYYLFTTFYAGTYPPGYTGILLDPEVPAIDFGDGSTIPAAKIPNVGPGTYRGNFVHTYAEPGTYDLRVAAAAMLSLQAGRDGISKQGGQGPNELSGAARGAVTPPTTGNLIYNPAQTPTTPTGAQSFLGSWVGRSFFGGATTYNLVGPIGEPFAWGISNSVASSSPFGDPAGGGVLVPGPSVLEIPTVSTVGSVLLTLLFAAAGVVVLLRRG